MVENPPPPRHDGPRKTIGRVARMVSIGLAIFGVWTLGYDLFLVIPWRIRWWMGEASFLALVAGLVVMGLRCSPPRPWPILDASEDPEQATHRTIAWGLQALVLSFAIPLFSHPEGWGALGDWDLHLQWYEALRRSVLSFGQFPWWNPWNAGGWLLAAEPQFGLVALDTPLVLLFGTSAGLRLATVADMMLAVEGTRRLARLWFSNPWAVAASSVIYGCNGAILIVTLGCRALAMGYPFLPWMLLYAFQIDRGRRQGVFLGIASAVSVLAVIQYQTFYAAAITAVVLVWGFLARRGAQERAHYAAHVGLAAGVCLTLSGWRLVLSGLVFVDYPRKYLTTMDFTLRNWLTSLVHQQVPPADIYKDTYTASPDWFPDLACYVGLIAVVAAVFSLGRGWRWWHTLTIAGFALASGSIRLHHASYWLREWPIFSSMHVVSRWRFPALLGLALAAGSGLQQCAARSRKSRWTTAALAIAIVADLALYTHRCLPIAYSVPPHDVRHPEGPPSATIVNIRGWECYGNSQGFQCLERGYGVIAGYCPQLGYDRLSRQTMRRWLGHPDYLGEAWSGTAALVPVFWSPNRIEFRVEPYQEVEINQNPGSWWWVNGVRAFPASGCAEPTQPFLVRADANGQVRLEIHPRGTGLAWGVTFLGAAGATLCYRRGSSGKNPDQTNSLDRFEDAIHGREFQGMRPVIDATNSGRMALVIISGCHWSYVRV